MENIKKTKDRNIFRKIFKIIETIFMVVILFICTVIVVQRVTNNEYAFLGFRIFRVETGSMIPKYNIADVILVNEKDVSKLEVGDDLVYFGTTGQTKGKVITHQIIRIEKDESGEDVFITKGIANTKEDPGVYGSQVLGVVQRKLYGITLITNLLLNRYTLYFIIILPATIYIFFMELYGKEKKMRSEIRARNKKAQEREEKERIKKQEKEEKIRARRLGARDRKLLADKATAQNEEKQIEKDEKLKEEVKNKKEAKPKDTKNKKEETSNTGKKKRESKK